MKRTVIIILLFFSNSYLHAQLTVAIADFKNLSQEYFLDLWEQTVPEYLKSEISKSNKITLVERRQLEQILNEQALSMTGLVDSSTAQKIGGLLGAQFIITGTINKSGGWTRIDAKIIRVSTGDVKSEKVRAKDDIYLNEMVELLANNIIHLLAGDVPHKDKIELKKYPTTYFLLASAGLTISTLLVNNAYNNELDRYNTAQELTQFDEHYDSANQLNKTRIVLASVTGAAILGSIYCWVKNLSPTQILAKQSDSHSNVIPVLVIDNPNGVQAGVSIHF